jgi:beta-barrel assembly-enhancing protease
MVHSTRRASLAGALACAVFAAPLAAQSISNPELFRKSFEAAQDALRAYGPHDDAAAALRVSSIGYRLVQESQFTKFPISFFLVAMPEPNAFALPGGQIFVTRGMLDLGLDDDALAGLLGHEIAHVVYEHGIRMERRALLLNILSQAALVGVILKSDRSNRRDPVPTYDAYGRETSGDNGDLIQGTAAAGLILTELLLRSYSREFEDQADEEGQRWAAAAGFDPDGTRKLFDLMRVRLPQDKNYGYWQTHPFFDSRVNAALARGQMLKAQTPKSADAVRSKTQAALLAWLHTAPKEPVPPEPPASGTAQREAFGRKPLDPDLAREPLIKQAALLAQPVGPVAEGLRLERLHVLRDRQMSRPKLSRDYGSLLARYDDQLAAVLALSPESALAATIRDERTALAAETAALYPEAQATLEGGIFETAFLETFLSNYPNATERPSVGLALGDAYSRIGRQSDAVGQYLATLDADPASAPAQRARQGLRALAGTLDDLAALQQLAQHADAAETQSLAAERLAKLAPTFSDIGVGAEYLRRFPTGVHAAEVSLRLNAIADNLYGEMVLYQAVGDSVKALERIQKILNHAPASAAAGKLRESAEVKGS